MRIKGEEIQLLRSLLEYVYLRMHLGTSFGLHAPHAAHVSVKMFVSGTISPWLMLAFGSAWYISNTYLKCYINHFKHFDVLKLFLEQHLFLRYENKKNYIPFRAFICNISIVYRIVSPIIMSIIPIATFLTRRQFLTITFWSVVKTWRITTFHSWNCVLNWFLKRTFILRIYRADIVLCFDHESQCK